MKNYNYIINTKNSSQDYSSSLKDRRTIEREMQFFIESVVDVCFMPIKGLKQPIPKEKTGIDEILKDFLPNISKVAEMRKFRNILVHKYGVIDDKKVFLFATKQKADFYIFIKETKELLEKNKVK